MRTSRRLALAAAVLVAALSTAGGAGAQSHEELLAAESNTRDWLYALHDYGGARYADIDDINPSNAADLQPLCVYQVGEPHNFQSNPIVYDGVMYVTTYLITVALDAVTCRPIWKHQWRPREQGGWPVNRGIALRDGMVVRATVDGYLFALSAVDGDELWTRKIADASIGEYVTMPPLVYDDLVLIGPAGSESPISGWVGAFRLEDGEPVWRFKTVPGADEPGSETWGNPDDIRVGGGAVWTPFTLDPEEELLYVAATNPAPDLAAEVRPGDNLYTNSLIALDVRSGDLAWYEQIVPNDAHDYDLTQAAPLFTTEVDGRERDVVAAVGKNGVLHLLDRTTHERIWATPVARQENVELPLTTEGVYVCPGMLGGVEWNGPAYSPLTNALYVPAVNFCGTFRVSEELRFIPGLYLGGSFDGDPTSRNGWLTAVDASTGRVKWRYESPLPMVAAVTTTSGGVVFTGEQTGDFITLDAESGEVLYRFNTGGQIGGGVATYELDGRQYVAVMSGRISPFWYREHPGAPTVFVFALPN